MDELSIWSLMLPWKVRGNTPERKEKFEVGWSEVDYESMVLLHKEATIRVQDTILDHHEISKRVFQLLLLLVSISTVLCGFLMNDSELGNVDIVVIVALVFLFIQIFILGVLARPIEAKAPGREPFNVLTKKWFDNPKIDSEEKRKKLLLYQELLNCQATIDINQYNNTRRLRIIDFVIRFSLLILLTLTVTLTLIKTVS